MSTISVPLTPKLESQLEALVHEGYASNKAAAMRKALKKASEDEAVRQILEAAADPVVLRGDLRTILNNFPDNA